jgi:hypothetical protein
MLDSFETSGNSPTLLGSYTGTCFYCGDVVHSDIVLEHVIPESIGGCTCTHNVVLSCRHCNSRKGTKTLEEFRVYMGFDLSVWEVVWAMNRALREEDIPPSVRVVLQNTHALLNQGRLPVVFAGERDGQTAPPGCRTCKNMDRRRLKKLLLDGFMTSFPQVVTV